MKDENVLQDPYAVYLAHVLHGEKAHIWAPYKVTAATLFAALLGERHSHNRGSGSPLSRVDLMSQIRTANASPQNPPKIKIAGETFDNDQVCDQLQERFGPDALPVTRRESKYPADCKD